MVDMCADVRQLPILEALYIKDNNPKLNVQAHDLQAPPSMKRTKGSDIQPTATQSKEEQKPSTNERRPLRPEASQSGVRDGSLKQERSWSSATARARMYSTCGLVQTEVHVIIYNIVLKHNIYDNYTDL
ncbi:hypothetical protein GWK47_019202 [Chionoecetes opilio]|uniref:Uncharacterized protein n=1 Tax=Chionoecetes opilio TaxID=41210 RepID=A0A8J5CJ06_CHIOP|nr:hypothetical protein GWK47_019202 [Chionoecetes opilio]